MFCSCCLFVFSHAVVQDRRNGSVGTCSRNQQCCKLGRKAARKSYTCQFEALVRSLEFQTASRQRLNPAADRLQAALSYHNHAQVFRRRLQRCQDPLNNRCFERCCKGMRAKLERLNTTPQPTNSSSPPVQQRKKHSH